MEAGQNELGHKSRGMFLWEKAVQLFYNVKYVCVCVFRVKRNKQLSIE